MFLYLARTTCDYDFLRGLKFIIIYKEYVKIQALMGFQPVDPRTDFGIGRDFIG
jgi:hypothetical protein